MDLFIDPKETVRLDLPDERWIEIKKTLTYGEQQRLSTAGFRSVRSTDEDPEVMVDWERIAIERIVIWCVDWSFRDKNDKPVKLNREAVEKLHPDIAKAIQDALDKYIESQEAEKKVRGGE